MDAHHWALNVRRTWGFICPAREAKAEEVSFRWPSTVSRSNPPLKAQSCNATDLASSLAINKCLISRESSRKAPSLLLKKEKVAPQMKAFRFSQSSPVEIGAHCNQFYHFKDDAKKICQFIFINFFCAGCRKPRGEGINNPPKARTILSFCERPSAKCRTAEESKIILESKQDRSMTKASRKTAKSGARETKNSGKMCCDRNLTRLRRAWKPLESWIFLLPRTK